MAIARNLKTYLDLKSISYETVPHSYTQSSMETATVAHVPGDQLAKAVIVKDNGTYLMVVVPSDYHVHLGRLHHYLGYEVGLATEEELTRVFSDCDEGAIPPVGKAYDIRTLVDNRLMTQAEIFFESGDHLNLVKVTGEQFASLLGNAERVNVGIHL